MSRSDRIARLHAAAKERILVLDGSWGVMIQRRELFTTVPIPGMSTSASSTMPPRNTAEPSTIGATGRITAASSVPARDR